jgi:hypothetical protein
MSHLILVLVLALWPVSRPEFIVCMDTKPSFAMAYELSRVVFVGEVVKIDKPLTSDKTAPLTDRLYKVTFRVEFSWKGAGFREIGLFDFVVLSDQGQVSDCFRWGRFEEGENYLVYAEETPDKHLVVQLGNRTTLLSKASADLKELRRWDFALLLPKSRHP